MARRPCQAYSTVQYSTYSTFNRILLPLKSNATDGTIKSDIVSERTCLTVGLNIYLSIIYHPSQTKHSTVEPIVEALHISIKKLQEDDDFIQAITSLSERQEQYKSINSEVRKRHYHQLRPILSIKAQQQ